MEKDFDYYSAVALVLIIFLILGGVTKCAYDNTVIESKATCYEKTKREECFK